MKKILAVLVLTTIFLAGCFSYKDNTKDGKTEVQTKVQSTVVTTFSSFILDESGTKMDNIDAELFEEIKRDIAKKDQQAADKLSANYNIVSENGVDMAVLKGTETVEKAIASEKQVTRIVLNSNLFTFVAALLEGGRIKFTCDGAKATFNFTVDEEGDFYFNYILPANGNFKYYVDGVVIEYTEVSTVHLNVGSHTIVWEYCNTVDTNSEAYIDNVLIESKAWNDSKFKFRAHTASFGWLPYKSNTAIAGTTGQGIQMEAMELSYGDNKTLANVPKISYRSTVEYKGWETDVDKNEIWHTWGETSGTTGTGKQIEAVQIKLDDASVASGYHVYYKTHIGYYHEDGMPIGWQKWKKDGETSGTIGTHQRIEALRIAIVKY